MRTLDTARALAALFDDTAAEPDPIVVPPPRRAAAAPPAPTPSFAARRDDAPITPRRQLDLALVDLAEVFAVYPYRATMPACDHCISAAERRSLGQAPARIPGPVLDRFVAKCLVTWGDVADLKRLLPEILTRTCGGRLGPPPALIGARLRRADWRAWPAAETPAVRRALRAAWLTTLATPPSPGLPPATRLLGLLVTAEDDLVPYLDMWEDRLEAPGDPTARLAAVLHLADLLGPLADGGRRRLAHTFPLARRSSIGQVDQWLRQPVVVQRLAHAAESLRITPHHDRMVRGREGLAHLRTER